jgi:hypothetical protein
LTVYQGIFVTKLLFSFLTLLLVLTLSPGLALAHEEWTSGGSELLKDARNPWFLNNVKEVTYCISIDEATFGTTRDLVTKQVQGALLFWKNEFAQGLPLQTRFGKSPLAAQSFKEVTCDKSADIRFQFGTLDEEQTKYLVHPSDYAALSVRTSYDTRTMKGKGFVYVSPQSGPLAYNPSGVLANAWSTMGGKYLFLALVHELGHVFGLAHGGSMGSLMSEGYVETLITQSVIFQNMGKFAIDKEELNFFSLPRKSKLFCEANGIPEKFRQAFNLLPGEKCVQYLFEHDPRNPFFGNTIFKVMGSFTASSYQRKALEVELTVTRTSNVYTSTIWLPSDQEVFADKDLVIPGTQRALGPVFLQATKDGAFTHWPANGKYLLRMQFQQGGTLQYSGEIVTPDGDRMWL